MTCGLAFQLLKMIKTQSADQKFNIAVNIEDFSVKFNTPAAIFGLSILPINTPKKLSNLLSFSPATIPPVYHFILVQFQFVSYVWSAQCGKCHTHTDCQLFTILFTCEIVYHLNLIITVQILFNLRGS